MKKTLSKVMALALALTLVISGLYASPVTAAAAKEVKVTQVTAKPSSVKLCTGQTLDIVTTIKPTTATNNDVTYASSNAKVATVSDAGQITAVASGKAIITVKATDGSKKTDKVTVNVYQNAAITNADVKDGVATLAAGTYGNVTISNTVDTAKVVINKAVVKGTLSLESGAAYTVEATRSTITNLEVVEASSVSAQATIEGTLTPSFVAASGARIANISVQAPAIIERTVGRIALISIDASTLPALQVGIRGFIGNLDVKKADNSNVTIEVTNSKVKVASVEGGAVNQKVKFTSTATDTSNIKNIKVEGTVGLTVNVPSTTIAVSKEAAQATVAIDRPVTNVTNAGTSTAFTVNSTVQSLSTTGEKADVQVTALATVTSITAGGLNTKISGSGKVTDVKVEGNNVNVATAGTAVSVDSGVTGAISGGQAVAGGTTTTSAATPTVAPVVSTPSATPAPTATPTPTVKEYTTSVRPQGVVVTFANGKTFTQAVANTGTVADLIAKILLDETFTNAGITAKVSLVSTVGTVNTLAVTLSGEVVGTYTVTYDTAHKGVVTVSYPFTSQGITSVVFN